MVGISVFCSWGCSASCGGGCGAEPPRREGTGALLLPIDGGFFAEALQVSPRRVCGVFGPGTDFEAAGGVAGWTDVLARDENVEYHLCLSASGQIALI